MINNLNKNKDWLFITLIYTAFCWGCSSSRNLNTASRDASTLIEADKSFSDYSVKYGYAKAFIAYADTNAIKMNTDSPPLIGKAAISDRYSNISPNNRNQLSWVPKKAELAGSGELGYTFGNYEFRVMLTSGQDTILYGNYVSIWKKQKDNSWKYVLDGGNSTPKP